jgi:hypothetical protein
MITNTCLIGGSLEADPADGSFEDSDPEPSPSAPFKLEDEILFGCEPAGAGVTSLLGACVDSTGGGSLAGAEEGALEEARGVPDAVGLPSRSLTVGCAEAVSVPFTGERAAAPRSTPNPRNTSTSSIETLGGGSLGADRRGGLLRPGTASASAAGAPSPVRSRSFTPRNRAASWGLRDPTRAPQARQ